MARRKSFGSLMAASIRAAEKAQRLAIAQRKKYENEQKKQILREQRQDESRKKLTERILKQAENQVKKDERYQERMAALIAKEEQALYLESRIDEVKEMNLELVETNSELQEILENGLLNSGPIDFESLLCEARGIKFVIPQDLASEIVAPQKADYINKVHTPGFLESLFTGVKKRYQYDLSQANEEYKKAYKEYQLAEEARRKKIENMHNRFEQIRQERDQEVKEFKKAYFDSDPETIRNYNAMVIESSEYPDGLSHNFHLAYILASKELVIEYELPNINIVPFISEYIYIKATDSIQEKQSNPRKIKESYLDIISSICLRTINEIFSADQNGTIETVVFNGFVAAIDPTTGKDIYPHLISVRVMKDNFSELNLYRVGKIACLKNLGAKISPRPDEMQAVKPVVDFNMFDKRYVDQGEILSSLEYRPNLMELNPFEFENLVSNLFSKMGLETKQTRSIKDGGVDAVAYDHRPILGGKVVIQAKRYKNIVGVSAVRDLYGTMMNEGANKGILVTTSHYGPDAYDFAKDKPIELIDGSGLLYLLRENGVQARIVFLEQ